MYLHTKIFDLFSRNKLYGTWNLRCITCQRRTNKKQNIWFGSNYILYYISLAWSLMMSYIRTYYTCKFMTQLIYPANNKLSTYYILIWIDLVSLSVSVSSLMRTDAARTVFCCARMYNYLVVDQPDRRDIFVTVVRALSKYCWKNLRQSASDQRERFQNI